MSESAEGRLPTVLVVEDDPVAIAGIARLIGQDCELVIARSVEEARALLAPDVDLVLLDLYLGDSRSFWFLEQLQQDMTWRSLPVMIISGSHHQGDIEEAFARGAIDYVLKPFNKVILRAKVSTLVDLKRKTDALTEAAFSDPLTGVANRRLFEERLVSEWRRARRQGMSVALMLVDLDHFKPINDRYGHQVGDHCLRTLGQTMQETICRAGDLVARIGGDEFAAILPDTAVEDAVIVANRLQSELALANRLLIREDPDYPGFTTSIGCSALMPASSDGHEELVARADGQLYRAKASGGRNCVSPGLSMASTDSLEKKVANQEERSV